MFELLSLLSLIVTVAMISGYVIFAGIVLTAVITLPIYLLGRYIGSEKDKENVLSRAFPESIYDSDDSMALLYPHLLFENDDEFEAYQNKAS